MKRQPNLARKYIAVALVSAVLGGLAVTSSNSIGLSLAPTAKLQPMASTEHPRGAPGRTLGLTRVVVPPGAVLAPHRHLGTQIARVTSGTLTYTVIQGSVPVRKGPGDRRGSLVRRISAGQTGQIRTGHWIVEQPGVHHWATNRGSEPVVIFLATLFPDGAPPSVPVRP